MADTRIAQLPAAASARPTPAARTEAVRAAQRAFFDTALAGEAQGATAARAAAPTTALTATAPASPASTPLREARPVFDLAGPPPAHMLRPGSLLDIKV